MEREKLKIEEKVTRMCFHMHVMKTTTQEEQKTLATLESDLLLQIKAYYFCKVLYRFVVSFHNIYGVLDSLPKFPSRLI
jgi:hypothetical protein